MLAFLTQFKKVVPFKACVALANRLEVLSLVPARIIAALFQNAPAARHNNGGVLSFVDGHTELWRWLEPTTRLIKGVNYTSPKGAKDRDLRRLQDVILLKN
jgi:prepilin-type processing-associated H-X9-DG protein